MKFLEEIRFFGIKAFFAALIVFVLISCEKDNFTSDPSAKLTFSVDTLLFDTVFTTIGTTTLEFTVHNHNEKDVIISSISLAKGTNSFFRMNVDGRIGTFLEDVPLNGGDSIYIFVEATIDPLNVNNPMVVQDSIVFVINNNMQDVDLVAWGQDVHLINGELIGTQTWLNDKPYLIYNSMLVDTLEVLNVSPGVRVYFHKGSTLYVSGTLKVNGTLDEPVIFQGDRLDDPYKDIPGQWGGMYFINGSKGNEINHATILNGVTGIHLGNFYSTDPPPDLKLTNTVIQHMTYAGISSISAKIEANNCLIADCGSFTTAFTTGGSYDFNQCTFANYWSWSHRVAPTFLLSNYYNFNDTALFTGDLVQAFFGNCIIYGSLNNEILVDEIETGGEFNYYFDHCLMKADTSIDMENSDYFRNSWKNEEPGFISPFEFNFQLDTLAFAKDKGLLEIAEPFPYDILGKSRLDDTGPDLGTYERIEGDDPK